MPNKATFEIKPIREFVARYVENRIGFISVDPFARNSKLAVYTNDIDPNTTADCHMDAEAYLDHLPRSIAHVVIFDPPYSPRQMQEGYRQPRNGKAQTQNGALYSRVRKAIIPVLRPGGLVLSFGWNSIGMGKDFDIMEILLCCHGGAHNDTVCMAERFKPTESR